MRTILPLLSLGTVAQALYFFIDGTTPKCFFEDLPKDTLVVGHYDAQEYDDRTQSWDKHDGISIYISVDVSSGARFPASQTHWTEKRRLWVNWAL
jgi:p24 family protein alpha